MAVEVLAVEGPRVLAVVEIAFEVLVVLGRERGEEPEVGDSEGDAGATAGSAIVISVLANDSFANGYEPGSLTVVVPAAHGTATPKAVNSSGAHVLYQPSAAGPQIDSFVYRVCDDGGSCSSATVLITINP